MPNATPVHFSPALFVHFYLAIDSQKALATRLGVPTDWLNAWEADAREPGVKMLGNLALTLGTSCDDLLGIVHTSPVCALCGERPLLFKPWESPICTSCTLRRQVDSAPATPIETTLGHGNGMGRRMNISLIAKLLADPNCPKVIVSDPRSDLHHQTEDE